MTIFCTQDGIQHPDSARYCMGCGRPLRPGVVRSVARSAASAPRRWEYMDVDVKLGVRRPKQAAAVILDTLNRLGREGWEADQPTDIATASATGRVKMGRNLFGWLTRTDTHYKSITIRLKRAVPS